MEYVQRWFPARTDGVLLVRGSSEVFLAMFAFTLVAGVAVVARGRVAVRAAALLAAAVAAFAVIFVW